MRVHLIISLSSAFKEKVVDVTKRPKAIMFLSPHEVDAPSAMQGPHKAKCFTTSKKQHMAWYQCKQAIVAHTHKAIRRLLP